MPNPPRVRYRHGATPPNEPGRNLLILLVMLAFLAVVAWIAITYIL